MNSTKQLQKLLAMSALGAVVALSFSPAVNADPRHDDYDSDAQHHVYEHRKSDDEHHDSKEEGREHHYDNDRNDHHTYNSNDHRYDNRSDHRYDNDHHYDNDRDDHRYNNRSDYRYDNRNDHRYDNQSYQRYGDRYDHRYDNRSDHRYDNQSYQRYDNNWNNRSDYRTYVGTVSNIRNSREFQLRASGQTYDVTVNSGLPRGLNRGDVVRVYGVRAGENNINDANLAFVNNR